MCASLLGRAFAGNIHGRGQQGFCIAQGSGSPPLALQANPAELGGSRCVSFKNETTADGELLYDRNELLKIINKNDK